jgi:hypothetical protein
MREARLRPEFADQYPGLTPGRWEPAARIAEAVLAIGLLRLRGVARLQSRLVDVALFVFRGCAAVDRPGRGARASDTE